ncbi:hypothetical protein AC1031_012241 [Aphanomyces cochlioides]|nr:hypothetical protein AC1031_012241 [Aphanomyces cochlioides]
MATQKRRKWTKEEDIALLSQVAGDLPFAAEKGQVTKAWETLASNFMLSEGFDREVDGKKVQNRFISLVDDHRAFNAESKTLSDDMKAESLAKTEKEKTEKEKSDYVSQVLRDSAMNTHNKRKLEENSPNKSGDGKRSSLASVLAFESAKTNEMQQKQLEFVQLKLESEMQQRSLDREERRAEREERKAERNHQAEMANAEQMHRIELAKLESAKFESLLKILIEKK